MGCEFTEEVSLLVDGELPPHEAARLHTHIEACAGCRQAREAFLLLRQELRSYELTPDPHAQSKALAAILSGSSDEETAVPSAAVRVGRRIAPREAGWLSWERLAGVFSVRRLRPAHVVTLALLLIATALGLRWLAGSHTSDGTRQPDAPALANTNSQPIRAESAAEDMEQKSKDSDAADGPTIHQAKTQRHHHTGRQRREGLSGEALREVARTETPALQPSSESAAPYPAGSLRAAAAADPALSIGLHAERAERLLRSFRNARLTGKDLTLDVADARRLSKRLLYSNIALRREAAGAGDLPVEGWLDSLEPILLDISNLPDRPAPDAIGSIKERIRRRQLVGVLQAQAMLASKP
jgi:negative regulator of sigma E activity